jgi:hypothetical protein
VAAVCFQVDTLIATVGLASLASNAALPSGTFFTTYALIATFSAMLAGGVDVEALSTTIGKTVLTRKRTGPCRADFAFFAHSPALSAVIAVCQQINADIVWAPGQSFLATQVTHTVVTYVPRGTGIPTFSTMQSIGKEIDALVSLRSRAFGLVLVFNFRASTPGHLLCVSVKVTHFPNIGTGVTCAFAIGIDGIIGRAQRCVVHVDFAIAIIVLAIAYFLRTHAALALGKTQLLVRVLEIQIDIKSTSRIRKARETRQLHLLTNILNGCQRSVLVLQNVVISAPFDKKQPTKQPLDGDVSGVFQDG